jgi:hypothetical protein
MALVCANNGPAGSNIWVADRVKDFSVEAQVDPESIIDECVEENNALTIHAAVSPAPPQNLALRRPVAVSSVEGGGLDGEKAVDGYPGTRWSSSFSDPQYITVDLGGVFSINQVVLRWETAFGSEYEIQLSDNGSSWSTAKHELNGDGGIDVIPLSANSRYVRMLGIRRGTPWGYSLYELEVYGPTLTTVLQQQWSDSRPDHFTLGDNFPNPFNPLTTISYDVAELALVRIEIYSLLGQRVTTLVNSHQLPGTYTIQWDGRDRFGHTVASGSYLYRMIAGQFDRTKRLVFLK